MSLRTTLSSIILVIGFYVQAQVNDDFSNGNFTGPYTWSGDQADFEVDGSGKLHLNAQAATAESYLVVNNSFVEKTTWEFYVEMDFNPSSSNQLFVYLVSDEPDISGPLNGYFVRIGNSDDEISLYQQSGTSTSKIIDGVDDLLEVSSVAIRVKVTRDEAGNWELLRDATGGTDYISEGAAFDNTHTSSEYFGFLCDYTSTRSELFYMDDVVISKEMEIDKVQVLSNQELEVVFNQDIKSEDAHNETLFDIDDMGISVTSAERKSGAENTVSLSIDPIDSGTFVLSANNVRDSISAQNYTLEQSFQFVPVVVEEVATLSATDLQVTFNQALDTVSGLSTANYVVDNSVGNPVGASFDSDQSISLQFTESFVEGVNYQVTIDGVQNDEENSSINSESFPFQFVIPLRVDSIFVVSQNDLVVQFNKPLDQESAENVANYSLDNGYNQPDLAALQPNDSSLILTFEDLVSSDYVLTINAVKDQKDVIIKANTTANFSYLTLSVSSVTQAGQQLRIEYNQPVELTSALTATNYTLNGNALVENVVQDTGTSVLLELEILTNNFYELSIMGVINALENASIDQSITFFFATPTSAGALIINEIMADPTPVVNLPNAEFVELYNPGDVDIYLSSFKLNGSAIDSFLLMANQYALLLDDSHVDLYEGVNVIAVPNFDALTNSGDSVVLRDQFGNVIDRVTYSTSWYRDSEKDDGGYTLERINPNNSCSDELNWIASAASSGGTPMAENSVFEPNDVTAPVLVDQEVINSTTINFTFSEAIDTTNFSVDQISIEGLSIKEVNWSSYSNLTVELEESLPDEQFQTVTLSQISDCLGNESAELTFTFYHDLKPPVFIEFYWLSNTELALIFDEPLNESDAEREENFAFGAWAPSRAILQDSATNRIHLTFDESLDTLIATELAYENIEDTLENEAQGLIEDIQFENDVRNGRIVNPQIVEVAFDFAPEPNALSPQNFIVSGFSRPSSVTQDEANAQKVILSFESSLSENKSYRLYMERISDTTQLPRSTPAVDMLLDTRPPDLEQLHVLDSNQLQLVFSEPLDIYSAILTDNYQLDDVHTPTEAIMISQSEVELLFEPAFEIERLYELTVDDLKDELGNAMKSADKMNFVYDPRPPKISGSRILSDTSLLITFNESIDSKGIGLSIFSLDEVSPDALKIIGPDSVSMRLYFAEIPQDAEAQLVIDSIADQRGNTAYQLSDQINTLQPIVSEILFERSNTLHVNFSHAMTDTFLNPENYQIGGTEIVSLAKRSDFSVLIGLNSMLEDGEDITVITYDLIAQSGLEVSEDTISATYQSFFKELEVIDERSLKLGFQYATAELSKQQFTLGSAQPQVATKNGEGEITLVFADNFTENQLIAISWQGLEDIYDRKIPDQDVEFLIDTNPPIIDTIISDYLGRIVVVFNEKLLPSSVNQPNSIFIEGIEFISKDLISDTSVVLAYQEQLTAHSNYQLIIQGIADLNDNFIDSLGVEFTYLPPAFPEQGELIITEIMADPSPSVGLPEVEYLEVYNKSSTVIQMNGLELQDAGTSVRLTAYDLLPAQYLTILDLDDIGEITSSNRIGVDGLPGLSNDGERIALLTLAGNVIDAVNYSKDWYQDPDRNDGGYSLELINPNSDCPGIVNWRASINENGGTPGFQNSIYSLNPDTIPPSISSIEIVTNNSLKITFNEAMDSLSVLGANIMVGDLEIGSRAVSGEFSKILMVELSAPLVQGVLYNVTISGEVLDCSGNQLEAYQTQIGLGRPPLFAEIIISEIMADPEPSSGLPISEYLELFNTSGQLISLGSVSLIDERDTVKLPDVLIQPDQYLLLSPTSSIGQFSDSIQKVGVVGWPSLGNGGEKLILFSDQVIDLVSYDQSWHAGEEEKEGGYSLEIIDPFHPCGGSSNWGSSTDNSGGTPGFQNAIFDQRPDQFGPTILSAITQSEQSVMITLDEELNPDISGIAPNFTPLVSIAEITTSIDRRDQLIIHLAEPLKTSIAYQVSLSGLVDCSGNMSETQTASFVLGEQPGAGDVVLSEVLFNPRTDGADFVELYNTTDRYMDIASMILTRRIDGDLERIIPIADYSYLMPPLTYLAISEDIAVVRSQYPSNVPALHYESDLPTMPNTEGNITLVDSAGLVIDEFDYSDDFHLSLLESVDGVSLERVDVSQPTQDPNNWVSASSAVGFATPGYQNSQQYSAGNSQANLNVEPRVFVPGSSNLAFSTFTTIQYDFQRTGLLANVVLYDTNGKTVTELANGVSLSRSGFFRWDGTNASGAYVRPGYYLVFVEVYDGSGYSESYKETVVVGR